MAESVIEDYLRQFLPPSWSVTPSALSYLLDVINAVTNLLQNQNLDQVGARLDPRWSYFSYPTSEEKTERILKIILNKIIESTYEYMKEMNLGPSIDVYDLVNTIYIENLFPEYLIPTLPPSSLITIYDKDELSPLSEGLEKIRDSLAPKKISPFLTMLLAGFINNIGDIISENPETLPLVLTDLKKFFSPEERIDSIEDVKERLLDLLLFQLKELEGDEVTYAQLVRTILANPYFNFSGYLSA